MSMTRLIELGVVVLGVFIIITLLSFLSLRPTLLKVRSEVRTDWMNFQTEVNNRNDALLGLVQAIRGFAIGHGELADKLLGSREVALHAVRPGKMISAVEETDRYLIQVKQLTQSNPGINQYPPFVRYWKTVKDSTRLISFKRELYNRNVHLYNSLLESFPQNLVAAAFGYVSLKSFPAVFSTLD
jgi:LemA protein